MAAPASTPTCSAQTSRQFEVGAKWRGDALGLALDAALFRADTEDEIGVPTNAGGRSTFQNVGRTRALAAPKLAAALAAGAGAGARCWR